MSTALRRRRPRRTLRTTPALAVAAGGWLLVAAGIALPWTDNRMSGARWILELAGRHPGVVLVYVHALLVLLAAVVLAALPVHPAVPATLAAAATVLMVGLAVVTPLPTTTFTGADGTGRPLGGSVESTLSFGPVAAGLGAATVLLVTLTLARARR